MNPKRLAAALLIGAAALAASGQTGVANLGRSASCKTASLVASLRRLGGFEILFGTVLTKMDPGVRRSAFLALAGPSRCPNATSIGSRTAREAGIRSVRPAALAPSKRSPARAARGALA
jgi:hypothetical protein